ncbi:hypothetical protein BDF14DRAFT_1764260 [Spinellus fusiger]|nr:hypothetical protein BDF14DRAFT_1764260 [Spinellus fusiger]
MNSTCERMKLFHSTPNSPNTPCFFFSFLLLFNSCAHVQSVSDIKDVYNHLFIPIEERPAGKEINTRMPTATSTRPPTRTTAVHSQTADPSHLANITSSQSNNTVGALVQYQLSCTLDKVFCAKVNEAVASAINTFTQVVTIKNNMTIWISYYNFCDKRCSNSTYGWGAPTSQFTLPFFDDGADLNYVYPQALAKQLAPYSNTSVWADHDVDIEINHDNYLSGVDWNKAKSDGWNGSSVPEGGKYWFINDTVIKQHQIDIRYIVLHELLHGLGFISAWAAYFWTDASPFRALVDGFVDPSSLQIVTPSPYWYVNQDTGPTFITGFQPTMIFDKFLVTVGTGAAHTNLSTVGFDMQNFCVQDSDAFIINFVKEFNASSQSADAHILWKAMTESKSLRFDFFAPLTPNSSFNTNPYLKQTYQSMTLSTGLDVLSSEFEHYDRVNNRPGIAISHVDNQYGSTPDFLMTRNYITGKTLEEIVETAYNAIPAINYTTNSANGTTLAQTYRSPIGPGILRILDSLGYSTVLTQSNYTTDGAVKTYKSKSVCDDSNNSYAISKVNPVASGAYRVLWKEGGHGCSWGYFIVLVMASLVIY